MLSALALITYTLFIPFVAASPHAAKGVGMPVDHQVCADTATLHATWSYDWSAQPSCGGVPMVWGAAVPETLGPGDYVLVLNEPNNPGQANLTPAQAVSVVNQVAQRFPEKKLVIGGTYDGYSNPPLMTGYQWLSEFLALYQGPIAGIHWHCYEWTAAQCVTRAEQMRTLAAQYGISELWVSEFAFFTGYGQRSMEATWNEAQTFIAWLDAHVTRYAWFAARVYGDEPWCPPAGWYSPLIDANGQLTYYGQRY